MKTYTFFEDAGHGWLAVPIKDILKAGIKDQISGYSYIDRTRVYLEEDGDLSLFMNAAPAFNQKRSYSENSKVRSLCDYKPEFCRVIKEGDKVKLYSGEGATIRKVYGKWSLFGDFGKLYKLPASNPFKYIQQFLN